MAHRLLITLLLGAALSGCSLEVGSGCDGCESEYELPTPTSERIPVATCSQADTIVSCTWATGETLVQAPLNNLQASLSLWVKSDEGIPATSNEGGVVTFDLAGSSWEPGTRVLFRPVVEADWAGTMEELKVDDIVANPEDLAGDFEVASSLEVWDIGLLASDKNVISDIEFSGVMSFVQEDMLIEKRAQVLRVVVDPAQGVELLSNGNLAIHATQAGYYRFDDASSAEFDSERSSL